MGQDCVVGNRSQSRCREDDKQNQWSQNIQIRRSYWFHSFTLSLSLCEVEEAEKRRSDLHRCDPPSPLRAGRRVAAVPSCLPSCLPTSMGLWYALRPLPQCAGAARGPWLQRRAASATTGAYTLRRQKLLTHGKTPAQQAARYVYAASGPVACMHTYDMRPSSRSAYVTVTRMPL